MERFQQLPRELRLYIWKLAVPNTVRVAFFRRIPDVASYVIKTQTTPWHAPCREAREAAHQIRKGQCTFAPSVTKASTRSANSHQSPATSDITNSNFCNSFDISVENLRTQNILDPNYTPPSITMDPSVDVIHFVRADSPGVMYFNLLYPNVKPISIAIPEQPLEDLASADEHLRNIVDINKRLKYLFIISPPSDPSQQLLDTRDTLKRKWLQRPDPFLELMEQPGVKGVLRRRQIRVFFGEDKLGLRVVDDDNQSCYVYNVFSFLPDDEAEYYVPDNESDAKARQDATSALQTAAQNADVGFSLIPYCDWRAEYASRNQRATDTD